MFQSIIKSNLIYNDFLIVQAVRLRAYKFVDSMFFEYSLRTVEALVSGHPREAEKVPSATGVGRLR